MKKALWMALATAVLAIVMILTTEKQVKVPMLLYHAFCQEEEGVISEAWVSADRLEEQLAALKDAGYTSVKLADLIAGSELPEKPIVLTADDGYLDNLTVAAPIFEKYGFTLSVAVIGVSEGKETYKETGTAIIPHFSLEQAKPWVDKGVIELFSHTYDMHQGDLDPKGHRESVKRMEGETPEQYKAALEADFAKSLAQLGDLGVPALAYPHGAHTPEAEQAARAVGIKLTMATQSGMNYLVPGKTPEKLLLMNRTTVTQKHTGEGLLNAIANLK